MSEFDQEGLISRLNELRGSDSVARFAAECGLGESIMRKYLAGAMPGLDKATQICRAKGASLAWLATGGGSKYVSGSHHTTVRSPEAAYDVLSEFVEIPHYSVRASAGLGQDGADSLPTYFNKYRRDWWQKHIGANPDKCITVDIGGDSLSPILNEGDRPIINLAENEVLAEAIYLFRFDGQVFIKYLERVPGKGLIARSQNPRYQPWDIGDGSQHSEFKVIGRAIYKETGERL